MSKSLGILFLITFIYSCTVTKRVHRAGWHIEWKKHSRSIAVESTTESLKPHYDEIHFAQHDFFDTMQETRLVAVMDTSTLRISTIKKETTNFLVAEQNPHFGEIIYKRTNKNNGQPIALLKQGKNKKSTPNYLYGIIGINALAFALLISKNKTSSSFLSTDEEKKLRHFQKRKLKLLILSFVLLLSSAIVVISFFAFNSSILLGAGILFLIAASVIGIVAFSTHLKDRKSQGKDLNSKTSLGYIFLVAALNTSIVAVAMLGLNGWIMFPLLAGTFAALGIFSLLFFIAAFIFILVGIGILSVEKDW